MNNRKEIVPNSLKEYRLKAGLTQKEVATLMGLDSQERISHWEKGRNVPGLINLFKLSKIYGASPIQLYQDLMVNIDKKTGA